MTVGYGVEPIVLPKKVRRNWPPRAFIAELPRVVLQTAEIRFAPTMKCIVQKRFLAASGQRQSLDSIARELRITKQAVAAKLENFLRRLRRTMIHSDYRGYRVRFRPEFLEPIRGLAAKLKQTQVLSETDWNALITRMWRIAPSELKRVESLLLAILGFRRFEFDDSPLHALRPIVGRPKVKTRITKIALFIQHLLSQRPDGLSFQEIADTIQTSGRLGRVEADLLRVLLQSMHTVRLSATRYRVNAPQTRADEYHAMLMKARKPLHYRELARRVRALGRMRACKLPGAVSNILGRDERFVAVAQSGYWALRNWSGIEIRTVSEIAVDEIHEANRPLTVTELYGRISRKRFVNRKSLPKLLAQNKQLTKLGSQLWTVSSDI